MASTATGANSDDARTIRFKSREHEEFFWEYLPRCRWMDTYHQALIYCLGISDDTRKHIGRIYDFESGCVKPECLQEGWQTSGSLRIVRMAFNLYCNGSPSVSMMNTEEDRLTECERYTTEDLRWFLKVLEQSEKLTVLSQSEIYNNKGTTKYYRVYADIEKAGQ